MKVSLTKNRNSVELGPESNLTKPLASLPPAGRASAIVGAAPLPLIIGMVAIFNMTLPGPSQLDRALVFEPPYLNAILQLGFLSLTSYAVGYISFKGYLQTGSTILILLGSGALAWGSAALLVGFLANLPSGPNVAISVSNTGALVASIFHVASATTALTLGSPHNTSRMRKPIAIFAYGGVFLYTGLFATACLLGMVPPFFILGVGQTQLRMGVLGTAAALFATSSLIFMKQYFSSKIPILYWYFLALGLTSVGLAAVFFGRAPGDPISWAGRAGMFLGGLYFVKAVATSFTRSHGQGSNN